MHASCGEKAFGFMDRISFQYFLKKSKRHWERQMNVIKCKRFIEHISKDNIYIRRMGSCHRKRKSNLSENEWMETIVMRVCAPKPICCLFQLLGNLFVHMIYSWCGDKRASVRAYSWVTAQTGIVYVKPMLPLLSSHLCTAHIIIQFGVLQGVS